MTPVPVNSYADLVDLLRERVAALGVPYDIIEDHAHLTRGYLGKILGMAESKRIGLVAIWPLLETLGLELQICEHLDLAATIDELGELYRPTAPYAKRGRLRKHISPALVNAAAVELGRRGGTQRKRFRLSLEKRRKINQANARKRRR